jgi:hypothetical protein
MTLNELFSNLTEGIYDPHIFKALIVIGGPGSGKSFISKKLIAGTGLRTINVDEFYEMIKMRQGEKTIKPVPDLSADPDWKRSQEARNVKKSLLLYGRLGFVLDVTGRWKPSVLRDIDLLQNLGYDVAVMYVKTGVKTAIRRQSLRARQLEPDVVTSIHGQVQQNIPMFRELLGKNFITVNNYENQPVDQLLNDPKNTDQAISANKWFNRWINAPVTNDLATQWIEQQKQLRGIAEATAKSTDRKKLLIKNGPTVFDLKNQLDGLVDYLSLTKSNVIYFENSLKNIVNDREKSAYSRALKFAKNDVIALEKQIKEKQAELDQQMTTQGAPFVKLVNTIEKQAGNYWEIYKKIGKVLWRGRVRESKKFPAFQASSITNRRTRDSSTIATQMYDQALTQLGIKAQRSNSIFAISDYNTAIEYGDPYVIIPKNTANFSWSESKTDLVLLPKDIPRKKDDSTQVDLSRFQKKFQVRADDFAAAVNSEHEVLISGEYFAIRKDIWKILVELEFVPSVFKKTLTPEQDEW